MTAHVIVTLLVLGLAASESANAQTRADSAIVTTAKSLASGGMPDSAIQLITVALEKDSSNSLLLSALADAQGLAGKRQARRSTFDRLLRAHKRSVPARIALVEDFFAANQLDSAAFFASEAARNSGGSNAEAFYWLGRIHEQAGRADSAYSYYLRAWTAQPSQELF